MELNTARIDGGAQDDVPSGRIQPHYLPSSQPPRQPHDDARTEYALFDRESLTSIFADLPFAQGDNAETYFTRPNRYFGSASTWKSWTEEERSIAQSIDALHGRDLGIHLFNSFALKRHAPDVKQTGRGRKRSRITKGKDRANSAVSTDHEAERSPPPEDPDTAMLSIPKHWTAWPLPPDKVPREELLPTAGVGTGFRYNLDARPSANLEHCLIAHTTKLARDKWETRQWDNISLESRVNFKPRAINPVSKVEDSDDTPENDASDAQGFETEEARSSSEDAHFPMFSSRAYSASESPDPKRGKLMAEGGDDQSLVNDKPVPLADDDKAGQYFLPSARHVLSKLDDLLLGLHKARYAYASKPDGKSRQRSLNTSEERSKSTSLRRTSSRSAIRKGRPRNSSPAARDSSNFSSMSRMSVGKARQLSELGLRDWSDVVGMASLTGWDPAVVERASERCGRLFGENMLFRVFHEGDAKEGEEPHFTTQVAVESEVSEEANDGDFAPVLHSCPHESCPRRSVPFRKTSHLQQHLKEVHVAGGGSATPSRLGLSALRSTSVDFSDVDVDMLAHPDVIICPIPGCKRGQKPFSTGRRLYEHIKRIHPDVDVKKVKQMESRRRGERRGRWSKEKIRQRSLSQRRADSREDIGKESPLKLDDDDDDDDDDV
ncbi:uncharacterized protein PV06_10702 [Exophiala oligosperma]|uniref:C2H2-type domain-containing protein n=1 Tax=Exophiala oligosperma TaxID=215243 RepID=A0A0D2D1A2_9EURO|nr:uncharacterized protein PV06_10702 [Exophiala oligosperma]KIW37073.1 hypothetical protein PV06_10702 [Exophiala oligosperma]